MAGLIGPNRLIEPRELIGQNVLIGPNRLIGPNGRFGLNYFIEPNRIIIMRLNRIIESNGLIGTIGLIGPNELVGDWLPDNSTQSALFLDKMIWEFYNKPNQLILSIFKLQLRPEFRS